MKNNELLINEIESKHLVSPKRGTEQLVVSLLPLFLTEGNVSGSDFEHDFKEYKKKIINTIQDTLNTSVILDPNTNRLSHYYTFHPKGNKKTIIIYAAKQIHPLGTKNSEEILTAYKGQLRIFQPKINFELAKNLIDNPTHFLLEKEEKNKVDEYRIEHTKKTRILGNLELISSSKDLLSKLEIYPDKWCKYSRIDESKSYVIEKFNIDK